MFSMIKMMLGRYLICQVVLQGCSITVSVVAITQSAGKCARWQIPEFKEILKKMSSFM